MTRLHQRCLARRNLIRCQLTRDQQDTSRWFQRALINIQTCICHIHSVQRPASSNRSSQTSQFDGSEVEPVVVVQWWSIIYNLTRATTNNHFYCQLICQWFSFLLFYCTSQVNEETISTVFLWFLKISTTRCHRNPKDIQCKMLRKLRSSKSSCRRSKRGRKAQKDAAMKGNTVKVCQVSEPDAYLA